MTNYFPVALIGTAWSWLMNLPEGTLTSWQEPCRQFTANFESVYVLPCNKTDLHAMRQCLGESLRSFIQQFSQCYSRVSPGVRDEKMLKKLATHDIQDVVELFSLTNKCARATEGHAWHAQPTPKVGKGAKPEENAAAQGGGSKNNNKKKKADSSNQSLAGAPTATVAAAATVWGPRSLRHNCCCRDRWGPRSPRAVPYHRWMETSISFDASDCSKSMEVGSSRCSSPRPSSTLLVTP
jgi:hypothetical protein